MQRIMTVPLIAALSVIAFGFVGPAYAQPLSDVSAEVVDLDGDIASVAISWNHDDGVAYYEVGCVTCLPNFYEETDDDNIVLENVTSTENGLAILYVVAHYEDGETITAKQVLIDLY